MKNAKAYEKNIKKLLTEARKGSAPQPELADPVTVLVRSVLESDAMSDRIDQAVADLDREFVDYNELRVAPIKDIVECIGRDFPRCREKALMLTEALNGLYRRVSKPRMDHLFEMGKRDIRRHLQEIGLDPYASAAVLLKVFEGHAIPVDQSLVDVLQLNEQIHPESDVEDTQGFLERVISQKDDLLAHAFFRQYIADHAEQLEAHRKALADQAAAEKAAAEQAQKLADAEKAQAAADKASKAKSAKKSKKSTKKKASKKPAKASSASTSKTGKAAKAKTKSKTKSKTKRKKSPKKS